MGRALPASGPSPEPLEATLTRISDAGHGRWHDEVLPNGAGDSWACVPIGEVLETVGRGYVLVNAELLAGASMVAEGSHLIDGRIPVLHQERAAAILAALKEGTP